MAGYKIISDRLNSFFTNNRMVIADSIPTEGEWLKGDIVISSVQNEGECGWICIEAGNPGKWEIFGSGGGSNGSGLKLTYKSMTYETDVAVDKISIVGDLGDVVTAKDKLIVHFNSVHLIEGVDYEIVDSGTAIQKLTEGSWNKSNVTGCLFSIELMKVEEAYGSEIVAINTTEIIHEAVNEVSLRGLGVPVGAGDKLVVHFNSTHLTPGVDYRVADDGMSIINLDTISWNESGEDDCIFAFELFKNVKYIEGNMVKIDTQLVEKKNNVTISEPMSSVEIGIDGFDKENDILTVYKNSTYMIEGVDYQISEDSLTIECLTGSWNNDSVEGYMMTFVIMKEVAVLDPEGTVGTNNLIDGAITAEKLDPDLADNINAVEGLVTSLQIQNENMNLMLDRIEALEEEEIDLSGYATNEDIGNKNELVTENKDNLVGAINELFQNANNGKQIIADAIGEPLTAKDTFAAMGSSIDAMTIDFRNALAAKGVNAPADKMEELIARIDEIVQNGNVLNNQIMVSGEYIPGSTITGLTIDITYDLNFTPDIVIIETLARAPHFAVDNKFYITNINKTIFKSPCVTCGGSSVESELFITNVTSKGCQLTSTRPSDYKYQDDVYFKGDSFKWWAIGSTQLPNNGGERTITPNTSNQVLPSGYYSGDITVAGDADLVAGNILSGKNIFGVNGSIPNNGAKTFTPSATKQTAPAGYYSSVTCNAVSGLVASSIIKGKTIGGVAGTAQTSKTVSASDTIIQYVTGNTYLQVSPMNNMSWISPYAGTIRLSYNGSGYMLRAYCDGALIVEKNGSGNGYVDVNVNYNSKITFGCEPWADAGGSWLFNICGTIS